MEISNHVLCRTPVLPLHASIESSWDVLKALIQSSSPSFYQQIKDVSAADFDTLHPKIRHTLWKYFNRAKYRATPFGSIASVSWVPNAWSDDADGLVLEKEPTVHRFLDWGEKDKVGTDFFLLDQVQYLQSNTSYYRVGTEIRYLYDNGGVFELSALEYDDDIWMILEQCLSRRSIEEVEMTLKAAEWGKDERGELLQQLIALQLLFTELHPNITGTDYFQRTDQPIKEGSPTYTLTQRVFTSGALPKAFVQTLKEAVSCLYTVLPETENHALSQFRKAFLRRFDHRAAVPLLEALDPELGVDYAQSAKGSQEDTLLDVLQSTKEAATAPDKIAYQSFHRWLLRGIISGKPIQLEHYAHTSDRSLGALPNSFSTLVHIQDGNIVAKQIGGCTANALLGRFTMIDADIEAFCRDIAKKEQEANPEVLFFDIAYQGEKKVDNINRRKQLYATELPILTWSESPQPLALNDIWVQVVNNDIILTSQRLGRRLVPRLATAYNHVRSDLAVFRFLSDLQHQGLQSRMSVRLPDFFPGLPYYPRLVYKNVIISPEQWRLPERFTRKDGASVREVRKWLQEAGITRAFQCGVADQMLCFDPKNETDVENLLTYCQHQGEVYLQEAFLPVKPIVFDSLHHAYAAEFLLTITHADRNYAAISDPSVKDREKKVASFFMPGSEWLYVKIYMHAARTKELFQAVLPTFLPLVDSYVQKWFFIRYADPDQHIRLRFHLKDIANTGVVMQLIQTHFQAYIASGSISNIQYDTYWREIDRYGESNIASVEQLFALDSQLAGSLLVLNPSTEFLYTCSLFLLEYIFVHLHWSMAMQWAYIHRMANTFALEHQLDTIQFKKINKGFQGFYKSPVVLPETVKEQLKLLSMEYARMVNQMPLERRVILLADLFHMHINRLHAETQRSHELTVYQYALKIWASKRKRVQ